MAKISPVTKKQSVEKAFEQILRADMALVKRWQAFVQAKRPWKASLA